MKTKEGMTDGQCLCLSETDTPNVFLTLLPKIKVAFQLLLLQPVNGDVIQLKQARNLLYMRRYE